MDIKINVINEMKKLRNSVYSDKYTCIDEIIQNCQRAKATKVIVELDYLNKTIIFSDNGIGCSDPSLLFEKNISGWDSYTTQTENPFGEGFFSVLTIADKIIVESIGFTAEFDVKKMFETNSTDVVNITKNNKKSGFKIILTDLLSDIAISNVQYRLQNVAKYIKTPRVVINGQTVKYEGTKPNTDKPYVHIFDNEYFKGWIRPYTYKNSDWGTATIKCFAFDRLIKNSTLFENVNGVINFKNNSVNLRSPDRKEFIFDNKYDNAQEVFKTEIKKMCLKIVKTGSDKDLKTFEDIISKYLTVDDYKKYIKFKYIKQDNQNTDTNDEDKIESEVEPEVESDNNTSNITDISNANYYTDNNDLNITSNMNSVAAKLADSSDFDNEFQTGIKLDGRSDYGFYISSDEFEEYNEYISLATYYNIPLVIIRNRLEENVIKINNKFNHISELSSAFEINCKCTNTTLKTDYEIRIIKLLNKITEALNLSRTNIFVIGDTDINRIIDINGTKRMLEKIDNIATAYEDKIYLNRKYLYNYKNLTDDSNELTNEDIKFIMLNLETFCHELSHLIYGNEDNTKEHFETINYLMQKIINIIYGHKNKKIYI